LIDIAHIKTKITLKFCIERRLEDVAFLMVNFPCHTMPLNVCTCITTTKIITLFMHSKFPMVNHQALHLMYVLNLNNKHAILCLILLLGKKGKKKNFCIYNVEFNFYKCIKRTQTLMEFNLSRNCKKINEKWKVDKRLVLS
jgi:hypothetical protein